VNSLPSWYICMCVSMCWKKEDTVFPVVNASQNINSVTFKGEHNKMTLYQTDINVIYSSLQLDDSSKSKHGRYWTACSLQGSQHVEKELPLSTATRTQVFFNPTKVCDIIVELLIPVPRFYHHGYLPVAVLYL